MGPADWLQVAQNIVSIIQAGIQIAQTIMIKTLMENMVNGQWLLEQARKWGIYFDKLILQYSNQVYNYFVQILEGTLFTPELVDGIMNRLYIIVGLVIFFKLATLAIKYIASPESFLDGKTGGEQLIKRILFGSVLIILMPLIFDIAMNLQTAIISDNLIGKILLPKEIYNEYQSDKNNTGKKIGMMVISGFFGWNDSVDKGQVNKAWNQYDKVVKYNDLQYFDENKINDKHNDEYVFSYVPIISTLAVGYYLLTLLKYAAEVVLRSFKLAFLQIIAPFSIVKWMLDPADTESLKKWINATASTYIMLFLRVLTVWIIAMMAYYLKNGVPTSDGVVSLISNDTDEILKALIVLGMFAFLKELPKLISDLFGYNLVENETIAGVANQAVGALKGLALGKVGLENQRAIMNVGLAGAAAGGVAGGIGSATKAYNSTSNSASKGAKGFIAGGAGFANTGTAITNSMSGAYAGAVSANFGSTPFAAFGRGANGVVQSQNTVDYRDKTADYDKEGKEKEKRGKNAANNAFNNVNQVSQNAQNKNEINITSQEAFTQFCESMQHSLQQQFPSATITNDAMIETIREIPGANPEHLTREHVEAVYAKFETREEGYARAASDEARDTAIVNMTKVVNQPEVVVPVTAETSGPAATNRPNIDVGRGNTGSNSGSNDA